MTAQFGLNNQLRFQGNAFYAMLGIASGAIINIILDPIFIFVWNMGVAGAALATIISQLISFSLLFGRYSYFHLYTDSFEEFETYQSTFTYDCRRRSSITISSRTCKYCNVGFKFICKPIWRCSYCCNVHCWKNHPCLQILSIGFGQGFQPVCGYNYGAGNNKRVQEAFWFCVKVATGGLLIFSALGIVFAEPLVTIFRKDDPSVISIGSTALRMQCVTFTLGGWVLMNNMLMQTIGKTMRASILAAARQGLFFLPAILILPYFLQLTGIQLAQPVADVFAFFLAVL